MPVEGLPATAASPYGTLVVAQIASLMLVAAGLFSARSHRSTAAARLRSRAAAHRELNLQAGDAPIEQRGPRAERARAAAAPCPA
jgi:hypothetical protein